VPRKPNVPDRRLSKPDLPGKLPVTPMPSPCNPVANPSFPTILTSALNRARHRTRARMLKRRGAKSTAFGPAVAGTAKALFEVGGASR
jgi:hypothetical protein